MAILDKLPGSFPVTCTLALHLFLGCLALLEKQTRLLLCLKTPIKTHYGYVHTSIVPNITNKMKGSTLVYILFGLTQRAYKVQRNQWIWALTISRKDKMTRLSTKSDWKSVLRGTWDTKSMSIWRKTYIPHTTSNQKDSVELVWNLLANLTKHSLGMCRKLQECRRRWCQN